MRLKTAVKYRLFESRKSVALFYFILIALTALMGVSSASFTTGSSTMTVNVGGFEFATMIFMFVLGICAFRENFRMMLQNGLSRKTISSSFFVFGLVISAAMTILSGLLNGLAKIISAGQPNLVMSGMLEAIYRERYAGASDQAQVFAESSLFFFCLFLAAMAGGYFISVMYYRMNKPGRIAVSVAVPSFFIFVLPIFDAIVTGGKIFWFIAESFAKAYGLDTANPYMGMLTSLILCLLFSGLAYLLAQKAVIKD